MEVTKQISSEASSLLNTINQGVINVPKIKDFLSRVEQLNAPSARKAKMLKDRARVEMQIK